MVLVQVKESKVEASTLTANVQDLKSKFRFSLQGNSPDLVGDDTTLFTYALPGLGFSFGDFGSFGATIEGLFGIHSSGKISLYVTFEGSTEDSAATMDLKINDHNKFAGSPFILKKPEFSLGELEQETKIEVKLALKASLGFELGPDGKIGKAQAQIVLPLPQVELKFTPKTGMPKTRKYPKDL